MEDSKEKKSILSSITNIAKNVLDFTTPKIYSMVDENNILGVYDEHSIVTKDNNFVMGIEIYGISYTNVNDQNMEYLRDARALAIKSIDDQFNCKILVRRREKIFNRNYDHIKNKYAKELINLWEGKEKIYENKYYILIETKNNSMTNFLQKKKTEMTTSIKEDVKDSINLTYVTKVQLLQQNIDRVLQALADFKPKQLEAVNILNLYAEHINGFETNVKIGDIGILGDSYISSNVEFFKDYYVHEYNGNKKYKRIIALKTYDTEQISSLSINGLLYGEYELDINFYIDRISRKEAVAKLKQKIKTNFKSVALSELENLKELVSGDRETMQYLAIYINCMAESKEKLNNISQAIVNNLTEHELISVYETINLKPAFFSFFPSRSNLNARKRLQITKAIATLMLFEKDNIGFEKNSWGKYPLSVFKNQNQSPFLFNLHTKDTDDAMELGHTMIVGGTGAGKTTLMSWIMMNVLKYENVNTLALDSANGLYSITEYLGGEYNGGENFAINPFSLEDSNENRAFLLSWISIVLGLESEGRSDAENIQKVQNAIDSLYDILKRKKETFSMKEVKNSIAKLRDPSVEYKLDSALENKFFNSLEDSIDFKKYLTAINMDFINQNPKDAGILAFYMFHKMIYTSKTTGKGFFIFVDEALTYLKNPTIAERINFIITQARKLGGVIALAFQDLNQLDDVKNKDSIIANMGQFIIFPTKNIEVFEKYKINLTEAEKHFLLNSSLHSRKVLIKNRILDTSNIVSVDLSKIGNYLKFLSSDADKVLKIKNLKVNNPTIWRDLYLKGILK